MSSKPGRIDRAVDRIMDLDNPAYGDERERAVVMESMTFGFTVATTVTLAVAFGTALVGQLLLPVVLIVLAGVPAIAASWYAGRRGVDINELVDRVPSGSKAPTMAAVLGAMVLTVGAIAYTVFTGDALIDVPRFAAVGPDSTGIGASLARGAVIGGLGGLLVGVVALALGPRLRARRRRAEEPDDEC